MSKIISKVVTVECNSSMIREMNYHREDRRLYVTFQKGGRYVYEAVPNYLFEAMIALDNDSIGKFFHANIRKFPALYPYARLDV